MNSVIGNLPEEPEYKEIEVLVSVTLSKVFKVKVNDYEVNATGIDEDGFYFEDIDYSNCNLYSACIEKGIHMPYDAHKYINDSGAKEDLKDWNIDNLEVVLND